MSHHRKHATVPQAGPSGPTTATQKAVASGDTGDKAQLAFAESIRLRAYRKWESAGMPTGDGVQFWLEAEQELMKEK
jgi:hypothetical protein